MPASAGAIGRGTVVGFVLGLIRRRRHRADVHGLRPGSAFPRPGTLRQGAIEGVASAETANNAYANASMVPLLALGIPSSPRPSPC